MWRRVIEVSGPTALLGADAANPSPYPLRTQVVRTPTQYKDTVLFEMVLLPYVYPAFPLSYTDLEVKRWRWNWTIMGHAILVPQGSKIALEMWDPPAHAIGLLLLEQGIVVQSEVSDAPDRP